MRLVPLALTARSLGSRSLAALSLVTLAACGGQVAASPDAVAGLGIAYFFTPPIEGVYCSGQPTPEQLEQLPSVGVRRVVTLRAEAEKDTGWEEAKAQELGIDFTRLPIAGKDAIHVDSARALADLLEGDGPVLVCCGSSNRVGALFALKARFLDGQDADAALQLGRECGLTRLEPVVVELLGK